MKSIARAWFRQPAVWVACVACALAWGRLALNTVTKSSPPREVRFYGPDGARLSAREWTCHRSAFAVGPYVWQQCFRSGRDGHWVRFDLRNARADFLWPHAEMSTETMRADLLGAVARSAEEGGLVVASATRGVWLLNAGGGARSLERDAYGFHPCLRSDGDRIDLVYSSDGKILHVQWSEADGWTGLPFPAPAFGPETFQRPGLPQDEATHRAEALGCYFDHDAASPGWRGVWVRYPRHRSGEEEVPIEFWAGGPGVEVRKVATRSERPGPDEDHRRDPMLNDAEYGLILVHPDALDRSSGGGVMNWGPDRHLVPTGSDFVAPVPPAGSRWAHDVDYIVGESGLEVIRYVSPWRVRAGDQWYGAEPTPELAFTRLEADGSTPIGPRPSAAVHSFWVSSFKWLPDGEGGFWVLGSAGEVFVHLNASLERTDALGFVERLRRALSTDRAKRNSDFYYRHAWLKKALFLWVLLAAPLLAVLLMVAARVARTPLKTAARAAAWSYLILTAIAVPVVFWKLSGVFW